MRLPDSEPREEEWWRSCLQIVGNGHPLLPILLVRSATRLRSGGFREIGPRLKPVDLKLLLPDLTSGITARTRGRLKSSFVERGKPGFRGPSPAMPTDDRHQLSLGSRDVRSDPRLPTETSNSIVDLLRDEPQALKKCRLVPNNRFRAPEDLTLSGGYNSGVSLTLRCGKTFPGSANSPAYDTPSLSFVCMGVITAVHAER